MQLKQLMTYKFIDDNNILTQTWLGETLGFFSVIKMHVDRHVYVQLSKLSYPREILWRRT